MPRIYSGGNRYYQPRGRRQQGMNRAVTIKLTLFTVLIALACIVRFAQTPLLVDIRDKMASVVRTDTDYRGAVEVIGRAVAGETPEDGDSAVMVFGRKLLGLEEAEDGEAGAGEATAPAETTTPQVTDTTETVPEEGEGGGSGLIPGADSGLEPTDIEAGGNSGFPFGTPDTPCEAPLPVFVPSSILLSRSLLWDEMDDNTPDEAFTIPSPDIVDDTVYTLPFEYAVPALGRVSSYFGYRIHPISGETTFHHGADLAVGVGTRVNAFADGTVAETGYHSVYGNYVKLDHGDGYITLYAHLDTVTVKKGKGVTLGSKIAESGNSGYSTGAHLHFEIRRNGKMLNPFDYLSFD